GRGDADVVVAAQRFLDQVPEHRIPEGFPPGLVREGGSLARRRLTPERLGRRDGRALVVRAHRATRGEGGAQQAKRHPSTSPRSHRGSSSSRRSPLAPPWMGAGVAPTGGTGAVFGLVFGPKRSATENVTRMMKMAMRVAASTPPM